MKITKLSFKLVEDTDYWDEFVNKLEGNPLQLSGWGELKRLAGWEVERIAAYDSDSRDNPPLMMAQVLYKPLPGGIISFAYIPRGPVVKNIADASDLYLSLAKHIKKQRRVIAISMEPDLDYSSINLPKPFRRASNHILPADTLILNLSKSEEELLKDMTKKHRQYIRKSTKNLDLEVKRIESETEFRECLEVYHETSERANFSLHSDKYYLDAFRCLKDSSAVWASYFDSKIVAFLFIAYSAHTSYELYGGATELGQKTRANYAMKWQAIQEMKTQGIKRYDFGGLIGEGVTRFKLGFKPEPDQLLGSWDYPGNGYVLWRYGIPLLRKLKRLFRR